MVKQRTVDKLRVRSSRKARERAQRKDNNRRLSLKAKDRISKARLVKAGHSSKGFSLEDDSENMQSLGRLQGAVIIPGNPDIDLPSKRPERLFNFSPERVNSQAQCKALDKAKTDFFIKRTETSLERSIKQSQEAVLINDQLNAMAFDSDSRIEAIQKELKWKGKDLDFDPMV